MANKTVKLNDLAAHIKSINTANFDVWSAMRELATKLDEDFYKSSRIEARGDFLEACGMERT